MLRTSIFKYLSKGSSTAGSIADRYKKMTEAVTNTLQRMMKEELVECYTVKEVIVVWRLTEKGWRVINKGK